MDKKDLGAYIRKEREKKGLTLRDVEEVTGISFSHLSKLERGEHKPSKTFLSVLAELFDCDKNELFLMGGYAPENYGKGISVLIGESPTDNNINNQQPNILEVPIIGNIPAGEPFERMENIEGYIWVEKSQLRGRIAFFLRVKGESMSGDGIRDGDIVLVVKQPEVAPSDIAVVAIGKDVATLKRVKFYNGQCMLIASNPDPKFQLQDVPADQVTIIGKVIEHRRYYE